VLAAEGWDLLREVLEEATREDLDVARALAQRRHADHLEREAVVEVAEELAPLDLATQVRVGGGNDPGRRLPLPVPTDGREGPVLHHAQDLLLEGQGHVADLVEEERTPIGLLEAAAPRVLGTGEGTALMAEELALEQRVADRGAVDRHHASGCAARGKVDRPRHELLSGATLAHDQQRSRDAGDPFDLGDQSPHLRRLAEDPGARARVAPRRSERPRQRGKWAAGRRRLESFQGVVASGVVECGHAETIGRPGEFCQSW
jgi:hypothetical protein